MLQEGALSVENKTERGVNPTDLKRVEQKKRWKKTDHTETDSEKKGEGLAKLSLPVIRKQMILD